MKRLLPFGLSLFALAFLARGADAPKTPQYSVEVKVAPVGDGAERQFQGEATVKDLATGATVFAPHLQMSAGKSNVASSTDEKGRDFSISFSVEGEAKEARFSLQIRDGETLTASEKASIKLR